MTANKAPFSLVKVLTSCEFKPFTDNDWATFAGAEGADPKIAELEIDGTSYTVILDEAAQETTVEVYPQGDDPCGCYRWVFPTISDFNEF